jgi:gamma-glutamylcyclotransferase (GGCT)/AIG2-like uncharacterized protein YtfP
VEYFAYGSNLFTARLKKRVPHASFVAVARLENYQLRFHKRSSDGSAKCNVIPAAGNAVLGVIFELPPNEKPALDEAEGLGNGYEEQELVVSTPDGANHIVAAYLASSTHIDDSLHPYTWYKEFVLRGARDHGFPKSYIEIVTAVAAQQDPDRTRDARKLKLLRMAAG